MIFISGFHFRAQINADLAGELGMMIGLELKI